jgi:hypothetical protein
MRNLPMSGGSSDPAYVPVTPPQHGNPVSLDDPTGRVYNCGTTWYDFQHNGTAGKMVGADADGFVHLVWMNGTTNVLSGPRQINYQVWDPTGDSMTFVTNGQPTGVMVNTTRAGYTDVAVLPGGFAFPGYHQIMNSYIHSTAAMDFNARVGAFTSNNPAYCLTGWGSADHNGQYLWPKMAISPFDSTVHMATCWSDAANTSGIPQPVAYSRGHATWDDQGYGVQIEWDQLACNGFQIMDTVKVIAQLVVASPNSHRVAYLWSKSRDWPLDSATQYNNDLYAQISEDGGLNWGPRINITNFIAADMDCASQDTAVCDRDTFRVYTDCSAIFDNSDNLHVAFTTSPYFSLEGTIQPWFSDVWHWDEANTEFTPIYHGRFDSTDWTLPTPAAGAWQRVVQRPSLCLDRTTGYLYCSLWIYDYVDGISEGGFPQSEAYISMSRNCGRTWSVAKDVTNTRPPVPTPAGQCQSERDITISDYVSYQDNVGYINMEYVLDLDAGSIPQTEGTATLNPVKYQRIPIDSIPALPLTDWAFPLLHVDSTGMPGRVHPLTDPEAIAACPAAPGAANPHDILRPTSYKLYQNYPNPFNPTTNIQFDLTRDARVTLKVFNVLGEEVATLFNNKWMSAGAQTAAFDASGLASGVYIYRIEVAGKAQSLKMVVMK